MRPVTARCRVQPRTQTQWGSEEPRARPGSRFEILLRQAKGNPRIDSSNTTAPAATTPAPAIGSDDVTGSLTDAELARKLQAEWAEEDRSIREGIKDGPASSAGLSSHSARVRLKMWNRLPFRNRKHHRLTLAGSPSVGGTRETDTLIIISCGNGGYCIIIDTFLLESSDFRPVRVHPKTQGALGNRRRRCVLCSADAMLCVGKQHTKSHPKIVDTLVNRIRTLIETDPATYSLPVQLARAMIRQPPPPETLR